MNGGRLWIASTGSGSIGRYLSELGGLFSRGVPGRISRPARADLSAVGELQLIWRSVTGYLSDCGADRGSGFGSGRWGSCRLSLDAGGLPIHLWGRAARFFRTGGRRVSGFATGGGRGGRRSGPLPAALPPLRADNLPETSEHLHRRTPYHDNYGQAGNGDAHPGQHAFTRRRRSSLPGRRARLE